MSESRDPNPLVKRVDALMKRQQEESQRAVEEVPLLTDIVAHEGNAVVPAARGEETLAADIERALVARLVPELNRELAALRAELDKELRRAVRQAVEHALAARNANPGKPGGGT